MPFEIPEQAVVARPDVVGELRRHQLHQSVQPHFLADFSADLLAGNREASLKGDIMPLRLQLFAQVGSGIGRERQLFGQPKRGLVVDRRAIRKLLDFGDGFAVVSHGFPFCSRVGCFKPFSALQAPPHKVWSLLFSASSSTMIYHLLQTNACIPLYTQNPKMTTWKLGKFESLG